MKIRIADRLLVCLAGLLLIAVCGSLIAQVCFGVPVLETVQTFLADQSLTVRLIEAAAAVVLLLIGIYCVGMLFRHKKGKRGFVTQQNEIGDLNISLKAVELLVDKCFDSHNEVKLDHTYIEADKDVLIVNLKVTLLGGVSVPLAIGSLQKQIKQYVTDCTGVDVREVRVQVEMNGEATDETPYVVPQLAQGPAAARLKENSIQHEATPIPAAQPEEAPVVIEQAEPVQEAPAAVEEKPEEPAAEAAAEPAAAEEKAEEPAEAPEVVVEEPAAEASEEPAAEEKAEEPAVTEEKPEAAEETAAPASAEAESEEETEEEPAGKSKGIFGAFFADTRAAAKARKKEKANGKAEEEA